ncbi:MAG TPA: hypothetical protein VKV23_04000 [Acidimicrobiales bacterium]|nr:hypothetical protein [Acidimicrobiales bacterium]
MKGRWAAGIVPRNFAWVIKDRLALCERPGGYAPHHRPVRRREELLWIRAQGFTRIVSLLASTHNLHAYEQAGIAAAHFPFGVRDDPLEVVSALYPALYAWLRSGEVVLLHEEELGDRVAGVAAGFLCWARLLPEPPQAISAVEQLTRRQLGSPGRAIAALATDLAPPPAARAADAPRAPGVLAELGGHAEGPERRSARSAGGRERARQGHDGR